jgi:inosine/xanthosine triphosphate pyrophosphatase family protein
LLEKVGITGISLREAGISPIQVIENGITPEENALIKAKAYYGLNHKMSVFSSDSGMEIDELGGLPGVKVRRWNDLLPDDIGDEEWLDFFLEQTKHIPSEKRTGRFVTAWAMIHHGQAFTYRVHRSFHFSKAPVRSITPGFPMSAVIETTRNDAIEEIYAPAFVEWVKSKHIFPQ